MTTDPRPDLKSSTYQGPGTRPCMNCYGPMHMRYHETTGLLSSYCNRGWQACLNIRDRLIADQTCCGLGERVGCVCEVAVECPVHGRVHKGSHE